MRRNEMTLDRRSLLTASAAGAGALALGISLPEQAEAATNPYFQHGVASGDPHPSSVILWTRVTPTTASVAGSGSGPDIQVRWEIARDRRFSVIVSKGTFARLW